MSIRRLLQYSFIPVATRVSVLQRMQIAGDPMSAPAGLVR